MSQNRFTFGLILISLSAAFSASTQSTENSCIDCHQQSDFYAQYPKLHEYYQQYLVSTHKQAGVTCENCHGGNASADSAMQAHAGVLPMSDKDSTVHYQRQPETCGQCHSDKKSQFVQSKHYVAELNYYQKSFRKAFVNFYGNIEEYAVLALLPSYLERTDSSLVYMVADFIKQSSHPKSSFYLDNLNI